MVYLLGPCCASGPQLRRSQICGLPLFPRTWGGVALFGKLRALWGCSEMLSVLGRGEVTGSRPSRPNFFRDLIGGGALWAAIGVQFDPLAVTLGV